MLNSFLAFLLGIASTLAGGLLGTLRPVTALKSLTAGANPPASLAAPPQQDEDPPTAVFASVGGLSSFCLSADPQALREAAAAALGLTPEALADEIRQGRTLGEVADEHGVSRDDLLAALQTAAQDSLRAQLDPLVAEGQLTPEQAEALLALQATHDLAPLLDLPFFFAVPRLLNGEPGDLPGVLPVFPDGLEPFDGVLPAGPGGFGFRFHFESDGVPFSFALDSDSPAVRAALAQALGLSADELAQRLDAGERLWDIAAAQGVSPEALRDAWREAGLAQARAELDAAVAEGRLTQTQADEIYAQIEDALAGSLVLPGAVRVFPSDAPPLVLFGEAGPFWLEEREVERPTD